MSMARGVLLSLTAAMLLRVAGADDGCSLMSLSTDALAAASAACGSAVASGTAACKSCFPAVVSALASAGVQSSAGVLACVSSVAPALQSAGAAPETLALLSACTALGSSNGIQLLPCQLNLTTAAVAPLAAVCASASDACRNCMGSTKTALLDSGLDPQPESALILNRAQYIAVQSCTRSFMPLLLNSGVPAATLLAMRTCPVPPSQYLLSSSLTLGGVRAADVATVAVALTVTRILGAVNGQAIVTGAVDVGARRSLLAGCTVSLSVDADTAAQQTQFRGVLTAALANGSLLRALVASGVPATSVTAAVTPAAPVTTAAPVSTPASTPGTDSVDKRVVAGAVAGSVAGTVPLVALAAFVVLRKLPSAGGTRASNTGPLLADAATGSARDTNSSGSSSRSAVPTPSVTKSSASPSVHGVTDDTDDSQRGWTAIVSTADEVVLGESLGTGGFATVYAAVWRGSSVAVKLFDPTTLEITPTESSASASALSWPTFPGGADTRDCASTREVSRERSFMLEVSLLSKVRHPNVLAVYAMVHTPRMLIMELAPGGSLRTVLARSSLEQLSWAARVRVLTGVAAGVEFLHEQGIIHCDLKSENVLMMHGLVPKVADFSISSRKGATGMSASAGTPAFMAPEVARGVLVDDWEAVDAYGFGCIMHDTAHANTGGPTVALDDGGSMTGLTGIQVLVKRELAGYERSVAPHVPAPLAVLTAACLNVDPAARPRLAEARVQLAAMQEASATW